MLILIILVILIMMINFIYHTRTIMSVLFGSILIGLMIVIASFILIWTKYGGVGGGIEFILYLTPKIGQKLLYMPISAPDLSSCLIFGKSLFLGSSMITVVYLCQSLGKKLTFLLYAAAVVYAGLHFVLLYPPVYELYWANRFFIDNQVLIFNLIRIAYVLCQVLCLILLVWQYSKIRIQWLKRSFYYIILLNGYLYLLFTLFSVLGPIQVSVFTGINYIHSNYLYLQGHAFWAVMTISCVFFAFYGSHALWMYSQINLNIGLPDVTISQKIKDNNASVRMFIHGMKNQLLVQHTMIVNLEEEVVLPDEVSVRLKEIRDKNDYMLSRINELYNVFKNQHMTLVAVERPLSIVERALREIKNESVPILVNCQNQKTILADEKHLSEAIYNIVTNSLDAILAKEFVTEEDKVEVNLFCDRNDMVFEITDTGEGIARKDLRKIFEPFYSKKNSKTNWGVGLSYVQEIVKAHYGRISLDSSPGRGTRIYVSIPLYGK